MNKLTFCLLKLIFFLNMSFFLFPVQAQTNNNDLLEFVTPQWERSNAPRRRSAGGKRGDNFCKNATSEDLKLTAIAPENAQGLTVKSNPIFYFFLPVDSPSRLQSEFSIFELESNGNKGLKIDQIKKELYHFPVISFQLPSEKTLNINQDYTWNLTVICNPNNREEDLTVEGVIRRVELSSNVLAQLALATPEQKVSIYAKAGIWYETVASIFSEEMCHNNSQMANYLWRKLLELDSVNLNNLLTKIWNFKC